jgi:hypothetical protein
MSARPRGDPQRAVLRLSRVQPVDLPGLPPGPWYRLTDIADALAAPLSTARSTVPPEHRLKRSMLYRGARCRYDKANCCLIDRYAVELLVIRFGRASREEMMRALAMAGRG